MKREVAVMYDRFSVERMSGAQARESDDKSLYQINVCRLEQKQRVGSCVRMEAGNTRKCVQSPLVVLSKKVRKEGGYFLWQIR